MGFCHTSCRFNDVLSDQGQGMMGHGMMQQQGMMMPQQQGMMMPQQQQGMMMGGGMAPQGKPTWLNSVPGTYCFKFRIREK